MEIDEKELSNVSDEDFANLGSSSESSNDDAESSSDESEQSAHDSKAKKNKLKKPVKKPKKAPKVRIIMNVSDTQYDVVKYVGKKIFKWKLSYEPEGFEWDMFWTDNAVQPETLAKMQTFQKINHFPGMYSLARKNHLGRNLMRMKRAFPENFKFFPQTFLLPTEYNDFKQQFTKKKNKTFIAKPEASCQGRGIFLTRTWESIQPGEHFVVQRYLHKPYLIDGLKFDMRIYVLLAGCDPLKVFLFDDGLGRFATEEYIAPTGENLDNVCMHLTNYAINKDNPNFVFNESSSADDVGHKRSLKAVFKTLAEQGHDVDRLWSEIKKIIIKTFCSVQPILAHSYKSCHPDEPYNNMCFEILGFDVMLDHKLKPWLIEVNHTPSFTTDTPLDKHIKKYAIRDALKLMNISVDNKIKAKNKKRAELQQRVLTGKKVKISPEEKQAAFEKAQSEREAWEAKNSGRYTQIYPFTDPSEADEDYEEYMRVANKWWEEWTGTSVKRNVKKGPDPNKPPPMIFGQSGANPNNRAKDIQSIYSQKLKATPNPKPSSGQNVRPNQGSANGNIGDQASGANKANNAGPVKAAKVTQWDENEDAVVGPLEPCGELDEENNDFMQHVAAIKGKDNVGVIAEDQEEDYYDVEKIKEKDSVSMNELPKISGYSRKESGNENKAPNSIHVNEIMNKHGTYISGSGSIPIIDSRTNGARGTSFRIKTLHPAKESPQRGNGVAVRGNSAEDQKFHFSKKFAHYMNGEKPDEGNVMLAHLANINPGESELEAKLDREREAHSNKKVPLKMASGMIGGFGVSEQFWSAANRSGNINGDPEMRGPNNLNKSAGSYGKNVKKTISPAYQQMKIPGNYIAPKLYELNLNITNKEEPPSKSSGNTKGSGRGPNYPRESNANINYFIDSQASIQKYYNFLTNNKK